MISQIKTGEIAEDIAIQHLEKIGYEIVSTNWRHGHLELDIIAKEGDQLVIVEVKSRNGIRYEHPSEAVTNKKIKRIIEATEAYIIGNDLNMETRFDVITVIFFKEDFELEHFIDAFYPTL